jgi:hypothetical protein
MRVDTKNLNDRRRVVLFNGTVIKDVLWADDGTGEVCIIRRGKDGRLLKGKTRYLTKRLRGAVVIVLDRARNRNALQALTECLA